MPNISIICPIYNEEKYIKKCIDSINKQTFPKDNMEIFFVDGMSTDKTRLIIEEYAKIFSNIHLLVNPNKIVPTALNLGIKNSKGDIIIRIDAHCAYPSNYISALVGYLYELNADNVGCILNTLPINDSTMCRAIAIASSHPFGVGNSKFRTGAINIIETDTVPFGCYRREVFDKIGLFDEELIRNQDDEFNARLINSGGKIFLIPNIVVDYFARDNFKKMSRMYYQYGLFKPLVNKKLGKPATGRQFVPVIFLMGLILGCILSFFSHYILFLYLIIIALYVTIGIIIGVKSKIKYNDYKLIYYLPLTFFIIHVSYGWGFLVGCYKVLFNQKLIVTTNR